MSIEMLLNAKGEFFDLFRNEEYICTLKGSLNKKEKTITFKPNEDICKGDKLVRKELKEEFEVLNLDILSIHEQPFYKKIFYLKGTCNQIKNEVNSTINISNNYASINTAGGNIESNNNIIINETCNDIRELQNLISKLIPTINQIKLNSGEKEDIKDDLDVVCEQMKLDKPKVARLRKAYGNIKDFVVKVSKEAAITTVLLGDWQKVIEKLQEVMKNLS